MNNTGNIKEAINYAVEKTFADMAFIDTTIIDNFDSGLSYSHIMEISFSKPGRGKILLFLPYESKRLIVENIYGEDWKKLHANEIDDCLLELLNILAGNFLNEYHGKDTKHYMSLPQMLFDESELDAEGDCTDIFFDAEGEPFKVSILI